MEVIPRCSKIIISVSLLLIIFGYVGNNLFWGEKSPIYFYGDSMTNIHLALLYRKLLRNEGFVFQRDLFQTPRNNAIDFDRNIYKLKFFKNIILQNKKG